MADIHDIAREAGVSLATVSRAVNFPALLKPATLERVRRVMLAHNYAPSSDARNLRRSARSERKLVYTVGFVADRRTLVSGDTFAQEVLAAIVSSVSERGYGLRVIGAAPGGDVPREVLEGEVDGVICRFSSSLLRNIAGVAPTVSLEYLDPQFTGHTVMPDYASGLRQAATRLLAAGHRRIAVLADDPNEIKRRGFWKILPQVCREVYAAHGLAVPANFYLGVAAEAPQGYSAGMKALRLPAKRRPDAIIGPDAAMPGIYRAAAECGVSIPDELSVVGVNGLRLGEYLLPALTTIDVQTRVLGSEAVRLLLDAIERDNDSQPGTTLHIPVILRERGSARLGVGEEVIGKR